MAARMIAKYAGVEVEFDYWPGMTGRQQQEAAWWARVKDMSAREVIESGLGFRCPGCELIHMGRYKSGGKLETYCSVKCRKAHPKGGLA